jgi:hypothetical protein
MCALFVCAEPLQNRTHPAVQVSGVKESEAFLALLVSAQQVFVRDSMPVARTHATAWAHESTHGDWTS